ncbi:MAG: TrbG/VirB9 family P-type conjugative transfer protein [Gemmatimonadaceae bacterium]
MPRSVFRSLTALALTGLAALPASAQSAAAPAPPVTQKAARTVIYHARDLVSLRARLLYTTLIVLPDGDQVMEATCGDKEHWIINVRDGLVSVKPTKAGAETNLNLIATSGQVYAFLLSETSERKEGGGEPDLTVYIERDDSESLLGATTGPGASASGVSTAPNAGVVGDSSVTVEGSTEATSRSDGAGTHRRPKFVRAERLDDYAAQAELARDQAREATRQARAELDAGLAAFRTAYPVSMRFPYRVDTRKTTFRILAMWHDDRRTFIQTSTREWPALYEYQDRMPALVNFDVQDGTYVVPKVLSDGYLQLGTARLGFRSEEGSSPCANLSTNRRPRSPETQPTTIPGEPTPSEAPSPTFAPRRVRHVADLGPRTHHRPPADSARRHAEARPAMGHPRHRGRHEGILSPASVEDHAPHQQHAGRVGRGPEWPAH